MQMFSAVVCLGLILTSRQAVSFGLSDLSIGGFAWSADTTQARRALGAPQRARSYDSTGYDEEHLHLTHWTYPGLSLAFNRGTLQRNNRTVNGGTISWMANKTIATTAQREISASAWPRDIKVDGRLTDRA